MGRFLALIFTAWALAFLLQSNFPRPATAETKEVRFAQLYGPTYLPAYVVYEEKLTEKHAARLGLPAPISCFCAQCAEFVRKESTS